MEREVTMREKLAQAIRKDVMAQQKARGLVIDWSSVADAALNALEEPTPGISAAGFCVEEAEHDPAGVFRAMIQAIREGK